MPEHPDAATVEGWITEFVALKAAAGFSDRTVSTYRERLARFWRWYQAHAPTAALDQRTLRAYLVSLQADPRLGPVTVAMYLRDVCVFCRWLASDGLIAGDPCLRLVVKVPRRRPPSYSVPQLRTLLAAAEPRERAMILVLLDTGLRVSELAQMRRSAIDGPHGAFQVIGKGDRERTAWLSPPTIAAIRAYLATRDDTSPLLWVGPRGPLRANSIHQAIARLAERAGIRGDVRRLLHAFRATFARSYLKRGGDLESLRELLGHSTLTMSAFYAQLVDDELAEKKRRINPLGDVLDDLSD